MFFQPKFTSSLFISLTNSFSKTKNINEEDDDDDALMENKITLHLHTLR